MRGWIVAALIVAALPAVEARAQTAPVAITDPAQIGETFLQNLKRGDVEGAIGSIEKHTPLLFKFKPEMRGTFITQIDAAMEHYGPVTGWERVASEPLGTMMRRDTYLVQHREMVVRWRFTYMKLDRGWGLSHFGFEDQPQTWFN